MLTLTSVHETGQLVDSIGDKAECPGVVPIRAIARDEFGGALYQSDRIRRRLCTGKSPTLLRIRREQLGQLQGILLYQT